MSDPKNSERVGSVRKTGLATGLLAALAGVSPVLQAGELGIVAGSLDGYRQLGLSYQSAALWQGGSTERPLEVDLEYSLGMVRAASGDGHRERAYIGLTPFARWRFAANTGAELGIGANVFSGTRLGDKDISTTFQVGTSLGLFHRFEGTPWRLGLRLTHYSNAGIKQPNPGLDFIQLRVSYALP